MPIQYPPIAILYFAVAIFSGVLVRQSWKLRPARGATLWTIVLFFGVIWTAAEGASLLSIDRTQKLLIARAIYFGITGIIFFWTLFVITYSNHEHWLNRYTITLLALIPVTMFLSVLFVESHPLVYRSYELITVKGFIASEKVYGLFFWVWIAYVYATTLFGSLLMIRSIFRFPDLFRGQAIMLTLGIIFPVFTNILMLTGFNPIAPYDPSPLAFSISGILILIGMRRFNFLDITPIAHHLVFKNVKAAIIIIDMSGRILEMNPVAEEIFNREQSDMVGLSVFDAFDEHRKILEQFQDVAETKTEIQVEAKFYELQITSLEGRSGRPGGRIIMLFDITEQKQLIDELNAYASMVAHDLKNPLGLVRGYAGVIAERERDNLSEQGLKSIQIVEETSQKMATIIDELLLFASIRKQEDIKTSPQDMRLIVEHAITFRLQHMITKSGAKIIQPDHWPTSMGYAPWIEEIWANFISNGIKYGGDPPVITLGAEEQDGKILRFFVRDNGKGMTAEESGKLFAQFTRLSQHSKIEGHGLGLSITQRIIEKLGGHVGVDSTVGEGSTFWFSLPKVD